MTNKRRQKSIFGGREVDLVTAHEYLSANQVNLKVPHSVGRIRLSCSLAHGMPQCHAHASDQFLDAKQRLCQIVVGASFDSHFVVFLAARRDDDDR